MSFYMQSSLFLLLPFDFLFGYHLSFCIKWKDKNNFLRKKAKPRLKAQAKKKKKKPVPSAVQQSAVCNSQWLMLA